MIDVNELSMEELKAEKKKAEYREARRRANKERRDRENHHKYMIGGVVHKYFPDCYQFEEAEWNRISITFMDTHRHRSRRWSIVEGYVSEEVGWGSCPVKVVDACLQTSLWHPKWIAEIARKKHFDNSLAFSCSVWALKSPVLCFIR